MFQIGYNTNGFKGFPLDITIEILAKLGYRCVALTLDYFSLNPYHPHLDDELLMTKKMLGQKKMNCVIETGAGFLLDPWRKHQPTLISRNQSGREKRIGFLKHAIDIAEVLNATVVSFWSGKKSGDVPSARAWSWMETACRKLCDYAALKKVQLAIEPEPGMLVENLTHFQKLKKKVASDQLGLTLDIGHAYLTDNLSLPDCIQKFTGEIKNIHIEDMRKPIHNHLFFGDGNIDFFPIFRALKQSGYNGPITVELSRHSHAAVETAEKAMAFIQKCLKNL
jgi:sugar phosphate isomerase/epimerase